MKRIIVAVVFGLIAGGVCAAGAFSTGLKLHWAWNGILTGIVVGSIFSYFLFMSTGPGVLPLINAAVNGVFGLIIEFFTTLVFKQRSSTAPSRIAAAAAHASA